MFTQKEFLNVRGLAVSLALNGVNHYNSIFLIILEIKSKDLLIPVQPCLVIGPDVTSPHNPRLISKIIRIHTSV